MQDSFPSLSSPVCSDLSLLINIFWLSCLCYSVTSSYYKNEARIISQMQRYFQKLLIPLTLTYSWEGSLYCQSNRDALWQTNFKNLFIKIVPIYIYCKSEIFQRLECWYCILIWPIEIQANARLVFLYCIQANAVF